MSCKFPLCSSHAPGGCVLCPDRPPEVRTPRPAPQSYQIARKIEDLVVDANMLDERREIDIAIEHLETAAMWLNRAHYAAKKEK